MLHNFSCMDLIFCNNQNLISNYEADPSIFEKCHHNIIFGKIDIHILLPSSYVREVWNYSRLSIKNIQKAVLKFYWKRAFEKLSVDEKVNLLNEILLDIPQYYIPNKKETTLIKFYHKRKEDKERLEAKAAYCTEQIVEAEHDYRKTSKLNAPNTGHKKHIGQYQTVFI